MSGIEATAEIKRRWPQVEVLGYTSTPYADTAGEMLKAGATETFDKLHVSPLVDAVALHEDALGALRERPPAKRAFEVVELGEAAQDDVDRALPVLGVGVGDVGEDAALRRLLHEIRVRRVDQRYHRTGGLLDDP